MEYFEHVKEVSPLNGHRLMVLFTGGSRGIFVCTRYLEDSFWSSIRDEAYFRMVGLDHGVLTWPNGVDIAPEEVWEYSQAVPS